MIVKVALNIPYTLPYDYQVPKALEPQISVGLRALVPVGTRKMAGAIVQIGDQSEIGKLKPIISLVDDRPVFSPMMLSFTRWIAGYYLCSWGEVLDAALPAALKPKLLKTTAVDLEKLEDLALDREALNWVESIDGTRESEVLKQATEEGFRQVYNSLKKKKIITTRYAFTAGASGIEREEWLHYREESGSTVIVRKGSITSRLLDLFREEPDLPLATVLERIPKSRPSINRLISKGALLKRSKTSALAVCPDTINDERFLEPNAEQKLAVSSITAELKSGHYQTFLLHGVTGSGKTEIYLHIVRETIKLERTALILIPEISLTPQVVSRFKERFGERIAVLHSGMADGDRAKQWLKIKNGGCDIVVGARSAIFAPLENIGLIIVDEEHDTSFKQQESPFYSARDAAVKMAADNKCIAILGSATPSVESYANARSGKYTLLELNHRVNQQQMPRSELIDLKEEKRQKGAFYLSSYLVKSLRENLEAERQALIFLNRRGYAAFLSCVACDQPVLCRNCSIALTWHRTRQRLICHHCGFNQPYPKVCSHCSEAAFQLEGVGTQRVERDLQLLFPQARFLRMDRDTVRRRGALERNIDRINSREVDFIIGTQLISKGHDFKHIGIVCMVFADMSLNIPDFRSSERSFQLTSQVSGRAGRSDDNSGLALIQSYNPGHYAFQTAVDNNFPGFYASEIAMRRELQNPPLTRQILIRISDLNPKHAADMASDMADVLKKRSAEAGYLVFGPVEAPLSKVANRHYWHVLLKSEDINPAKGVLRELMFQRKGLRVRSGTRISIDVDPMTML